MKKFLFSAFFFVVSIGIGSSAKYALAGTESTLGWLWGGAEMLDVNGVTPPNNGIIDGDENGLGWVSMNNRDCDPNNDATVDASEHTANPACPAGGIARYGVDIPMADGNLSGYAWSEHYGWVSFQAADVVGCLALGNGVVGPCNARRSGNTLLGFARILAIRDAGANAGGWSGWISLSDANFGGSNYGVTINASNHLMSYAYSDELGWIDFSITSISPVASLKICPNPCNFGVSPFQKPGTFSSVPTTLYACYGPGSDCSTGSLVAGTWTQGNPTPDAIDISRTSTDTPQNSIVNASVYVSSVYTGTASADEDITLSYTPPASPLLTVTATARVSCVPLTCLSFSAQTVTYCPKDPQQSFNNNCSGTVSCPGTKVCKYDWTEGAP